jgi:hypothetical protein
VVVLQGQRLADRAVAQLGYAEVRASQAGERVVVFDRPEVKAGALARASP